MDLEQARIIHQIIEAKKHIAKASLNIPYHISDYNLEQTRYKLENCSDYLDEFLKTLKDPFND